MTRYRVTLETSFQTAPQDMLEEARIMAFLEDVLDHLEDWASSGADADAGGALSSGAVHVSVTVDAADPRDALEDGAKLIVRAIEAAGTSIDGEWWRERFVVEPEEAPPPLALAGDYSG